MELLTVENSFEEEGGFGVSDCQRVKFCRANMLSLPNTGYKVTALTMKALILCINPEF